MSYASPVPARIAQWASSHLHSTRALERDEIEQHWTALCSWLDVGRGTSASILDAALSDNVSQGRSGRRRLRELVKEEPEVLLLFSRYTFGWMGTIRPADVDELSYQTLGPFIGDVVVLEPDLQWAFVLSDHVGEGLLTPAPRGAPKGRAKWGD